MVLNSNRSLLALIIASLFLIVGCSSNYYSEQEVMELLPGTWSVKEEPIKASSEIDGWEGEIRSKDVFYTFNADGSGWYEMSFMLVNYSPDDEGDVWNQWLSLEAEITWWYEDSGIQILDVPGSYFSHYSTENWDMALEEMNTWNEPPTYYEIAHIDQLHYRMVSEPDDNWETTESIGTRVESFEY
ncbi:MAG: hypothetical protein ACO3MV_06875 [Flavobacteriales bacterium]